MSGLDRCDTGGFAMLPHWVVDAVDSPVTLRVFCVLARHANTEGAAWPSMERIAELSRVSISTLRRSLNELQVIGALEIRTRHDASGRQQSNMFFLRMAHPSSRHDVLGAVDMTAPTLPPMTPSHPSTHEGGEASTHGTQNNNQKEQETTTKAFGDENAKTLEPADAATAQLLQTAALGQVLVPTDDEPPWWHAHPDPLVRAFGAACMDVPKFRAAPLKQQTVETMVGSIRAIAPTDSAVQYELGTWVTYNAAQPKKGGQKDPVMAFRNWCAKRQGTWALERERRQTRGAQRRQNRNLDPLGDHLRLMEHGVQEPFE